MSYETISEKTVNQIETNLREIVDHKTDLYLNTLVEDCTDWIENVDGVLKVKEGVLHPMFKDHKDQIKQILLNYFLENTIMKVG